MSYHLIAKRNIENVLFRLSTGNRKLPLSIYVFALFF
jgi:hypothetical protein